jgi:hypothetical protein
VSERLAHDARQADTATWSTTWSPRGSDSRTPRGRDPLLFAAPRPQAAGVHIRVLGRFRLRRRYRRASVRRFQARRFRFNGGSADPDAPSPIEQMLDATHIGPDLLRNAQERVRRRAHRLCGVSRGGLGRLIAPARRAGLRYGARQTLSGQRAPEDTIPQRQIAPTATFSGTECDVRRRPDMNLRAGYSFTLAGLIASFITPTSRRRSTRRPSLETTASTTWTRAKVVPSRGRGARRERLLQRFASRSDGGEDRSAGRPLLRERTGATVVGLGSRRASRWDDSRPRSAIPCGRRRVPHHSGVDLGERGPRDQRTTSASGPIALRRERRAHRGASMSRRRPSTTCSAPG